MNGEWGVGDKVDERVFEPNASSISCTSPKNRNMLETYSLIAKVLLRGLNPIKS
jgi:hypothetical protein